MVNPLYSWTFRDPFHPIFIETTTTMSIASNAFLILIAFLSSAGQQIGAVVILGKKVFNMTTVRLLPISPGFLCSVRYLDVYWTCRRSAGVFILCAHRYEIFSTSISPPPAFTSFHDMEEGNCSEVNIISL